MSNWSDGYINSIGYTHGYFSGLNPQSVIIPFLTAGIKPPKIVTACELGFGQGVSFAVHSIATDAQWHGTDFNPTHAHNAKNLLEQSGMDSSFACDQSFAEFCQRDDLPDFDFIAFHGIWSWISDENRHIIVDFLRRKLKVGGVVYISYNTLPGWAANSPIRHLLSEYNKITFANTSPANLSSLLDKSEELLSLSYRLQEETPNMKDKIISLKDKNPVYLAHEYLNSHWQPMYFAEVEKWLADAKLTYAASSDFLDDFQSCLFDDEQQQFMAQIDNPSFAQTAKDYLLNVQFRRDLWVKGGLPLSREAVFDEWSKLNVRYIHDVNQFEYKASRRRSVELNKEVFTPVLTLLADNKTHNVGELYKQLDNKVSQRDLIVALSILNAKDDLILVQDEQVVQAKAAYCHKFNLQMLESAKSSSSGSIHLISPLAGSAFMLTRIDALFLLAHKQGHKKDKWAKFAWQILDNAGQRMIKNGEELLTAEDNLAHLAELTDNFLNDSFKTLQALEIV
ncbi:methyltransferase regulatory domain-containing protein [Moraxella sp. ZJ142]|uniref:methyltransferase regulatory domain-containing protein n=1 Tax=Moraxella marmotae TaxID=3344520 RepID=UPI0035D490D6